MGHISETQPQMDENLNYLILRALRVKFLVRSQSLTLNQKKKLQQISLKKCYFMVQKIKMSCSFKTYPQD